MGIVDIKFKGEICTWANNREGEGFIQERLDKFFGSAEWMLSYNTTEVKHVMRQASDHSLFLLDSNPVRKKTKARFIFKNRWTKRLESENIIREVWYQQVVGSRMFRVQKKLKLCKQKFIKWRKEEKENSRTEIELIQKEMESMQQQREKGLGGMGSAQNITMSGI